MDNPEQDAGILLPADVPGLCYICALVGLKWLFNGGLALTLDWRFYTHLLPDLNHKFAMI